MTWKSFDEITSNDIATNYFHTLLELIRENDSPVLYCHLKEDIISVPIPGIMIDEVSSMVVRTKIKLPLSVDFSFRVGDGEKEIGFVHLVHQSRKLDEDNRFNGYNGHTRRMLNHQAGLRLRHLMPLNRDLYFMNDLSIKRYIAVDEGLIESLHDPHSGSTLDTLTLDALQSID